MSETSAALLARLMGLHTTEVDLSLDRTWALLDRLDNPERHLPPVIHIAGTNGKGSTLAMIDAGLREAGDACHAYTSPHLVRFHERVRLAGQEIDEPRLCRHLTRVIGAIDGAVTFFEATTCAAFDAFATYPADWLLLEVGLGGRMDTTNIVDRPALTVITPVGMDHQAFLGDTLSQIAGEKAGILKREVPCIVARQEDEALDIIEARAARLGVPLFAYGQHWHVTEDRGRLVFQDEAGLLDLPLPKLLGQHQIENAGTALATLRYLGCDEDTCAAAVTNVHWPARMQRLRQGPLVRTAPEAELWLDSAHNAHATEALAHTLATMPPRETHLIFGMLANREPHALLAPLQAHAESLTAIPIPGDPKSADPSAIARQADRLGISSNLAPTALEAVAAVAKTSPQARIVIFGSLYLAGAILAENG